MVQILCTHICNGRIICVENISGMKGEELKKDNGDRQ
jgi:hypothetical protein